MSIQFEDVSVVDAFTTRLHAFTNQVQAGEFIVILGRNGAGKSTLMDVTAGLLKPTMGRVTHIQSAEGENASSTSGREGTSSCAYLFQSPEQGLFAGTIIEEFALTWNIRATKVRARSAEVSSWLRTAGLPADDLDATPATWSTGMQRRFAFLLAMAQSPITLLLDEPSAGLDESSLAITVQQIRDFHEGGGTVLLATHDLDTFMPLATRVWLLEAGRLVFDGTPTELYAAPSLLLSHGIGLPASLRLQMCLRDAGILDHVGLLSPEELAARVQAFDSDPVGVEVTPSESSAFDKFHGIADHSPEQHQDDESHDFSRLDPRSRWVAVTALVIAIAASHTMGSRWTSVGLTAIFLLLFRAKVKRILQLTLPWLLYALFTGIIAGTEVGWPHRSQPYAFHISSTLSAMMTVLPYWCFLQLGQLLVTKTSTLQLQGMVDWLARRIHLHQSAHKLLVLTVGMVFRFIPAISIMYRGQTRAYRGRTLAGSTKQALAWLRVSHILAPLVIRLIQYGETTTDAIVARKILDVPVRYDILVDQSWTRKDWAFTAFSLLAAAALFVENSLSSH